FSHRSGNDTVAHHHYPVDPTWQVALDKHVFPGMAWVFTYGLEGRRELIVVLYVRRNADSTGARHRLGDHRIADGLRKGSGASDVGYGKHPSFRHWNSGVGK